MLIIHLSQDPVEKGLVGFFRESKDEDKVKQKALDAAKSFLTPTTFLVLSTLWSIKTVITTSLKIIKTQKVECPTSHNIPIVHL